MQSFLEETITQIVQKNPNLSDTTVILPSKRSVGFFKKLLAAHSDHSFFAPHIISIEEFVEEISGIAIVPQTELLIKGYQIYSNFSEESFDEYLNWAPTLFNDFNELDRHLVPPKQFFDYLSSIKTMEKWGVKNEQTSFIKKFLAFWNTLFPFYEKLQESLLSIQRGYQGMAYRKATEDLEHYIAHHGNRPHFFIGFNALNKAEEMIVQELLEQGTASMYWDMDQYFAENVNHSAALFYRKYLQQWKYYQRNNQPILASNFSSPKKFKIVQTQGDIEQSKYIGNLLQEYSEEQLNDTAIVLADENLLIPVLYALPNHITTANVTMGFPLKATPAGMFFKDLIHFQEKNVPLAPLYYKNIQRILQHAAIQLVLKDSEALLQQIAYHNLTYFSLEKLLELSPSEDQKMVTFLFKSWENNPLKGLEALRAILEILMQKKMKAIEQVVAQKISKNLLEIESTARQYDLKEFSVLKNLFDELVDRDPLDFEGDAYQGLQIMGMLETRVLDFKHVIMLSVNEGLLPSGRTQNSYITHDLKKQFELPSFTEKDAVYAYHFFRLMQRVQSATLIYNNATQGLHNGEKSRFLRQLEIAQLPNHQIDHVPISQPIVWTDKQIISIDKMSSVMERLSEISNNGFSPSALASYIRNPLDFYQQRILKIKEVEEVEETVAYNTLGTVVHEVLEILYHPFIGEPLSEKALIALLSKIPALVTSKFKEHYKLGDITKGKNLIIFEVAKQYVINLIELDLSLVKQGNVIELLKLESELKIPLSIENLPFPVFLKGTVDRIDCINGQHRVIDYKTGKVTQTDLEIVDWEALIAEDKYSKAFQVLCYAFMQQQEDPMVSLQAGVFSFKNLNSGFLKFSKKPAARSTQKEPAITSEVLQNFETQLHSLILEVCNPKLPFEEKEIKKASF